MSRIPPASRKKRNLEVGEQEKHVRPQKRFRKQQDYHSSSEDSDAFEAGFTPVDLNESDEEEDSKSRPKLQKPGSRRDMEPASESSEDGDGSPNSRASESESDDLEDLTALADTTNPQKASKRNDPKAFSNSISKILSTKLPQSARKDPVLSRSRRALEQTTSLANERLEKKARAQLKAEKKEELERGRIKDVLGLESGITGQVAEEEKRLRKTAQRGVVKLFNAVRAAQVRGEQAAKEEQKKGTVGIDKRGDKIKEMSKQGFLDLINGQKKQKGG